MIIRTVVSFLILTIPLHMQAVIRVASANGNWNTAGTWSPSGVPSCGDTMVVNAGVTVTVTAHFDKDEPSCADKMQVKILGTLKFNTGIKMYLPCSSYVEIPTGGQLQKGGGGGSSNLIDICATTVWQASNGNISGPTALGSGTPLPVEISSFFAKMLDNLALLDWITASERNNSHFEVERSIDGNEWEYLGRVHGAGTSNQPTSYSYQDSGVDVFNDYYYRLRQYDFNGQSFTSPIVIAEGLNNTQIPGYDIITRGRIIEIIFREPSEKDIGIMVVDAAGELVSHDKLGKVSQGEMLSFDIPFGRSGWFAIVIQVGSSIQTEKMVLLK